MKRKQKILFAFAFFALTAFALWTLALKITDLRPIGPQGSEIGFAGLNKSFHELTGVHMSLYAITDWLGLIPIACAGCFAILGLYQWITRKSILKVDRDILILGGFYIAVIALYLFFEEIPVNYRPILINGYLEASYPSSTTLLTLCVMPTTIIQLNARIKNRVLKQAVILVLSLFTLFMVVGRLVSGVHWLSDIVGGILLSAGLVFLYCALCPKLLNR